MELNAEQIKKYRESLTDRALIYAENRAYVEGKNPAIHRERKKKAPDNRVPVPLAKSSIEEMSGYAGRPGDIVLDWDKLGVDESAEAGDEYLKKTREWEDDNDDDLHITELYAEGLSQGIAYELWWAEQGPEGFPAVPKWTMVDGASLVIIKTNSLRPELIAAIRYWKNENKEYAQVYYPLKSEAWRLDNDQWVREPEEDTDYPYSVVPVIEFPINRERIPFFEAQKGIIDTIDKLISKSANEVDRFNALLALFPGKVGPELARKIEQSKLLDNMAEWDADKWPRYLEKNLAGIQAFYTDLADRLERLYHATIKVPDFSDESFANNASGIAMAYKLIGMEFRAALIEAYFKKGFYQRKQLIDDIFRVSTSSVNTDEYTLTVKCHRNLPVDDMGKLQSALQMSALGVSKETILRWLPQSIIEDWERELARIDGDNAQRVDLIGADVDSEEPQQITENIQQTALNGAQVSALQELAASVAEGVLPRESAIAISKAAFPAMSEDILGDIFGPIKAGGAKVDV